ncbi:MAG TPA: UvrD-helicase domain-containing protein [Gemmatimonadales bacterium]|nr:UvrD-helicase domain-containing protein [Gemmatimonadales bacterium]
MKPPTDSQWEAIRTTDRHLLVTAGAGTGKTTTVVGRILYLLGAEVRGETRPTPLALRDIGAITYTNAAAADLKRKLRKELRAAGLRGLACEVDSARIGTIHGFCGDILREFALRGGWTPSIRVLEETDGAALMAEAIHDVVLAALEERSVEGLDGLFASWPVGKVEGWVARLVGESARLDRIAAEREGLGALERSVVELAQLARTEVTRRLREAGAVDFDRMIIWTRDLLARDPLVRRTLQRRLRTLIVDEFQDVDPVQREIAYLLGEPESGRADTTRLMLVGDPKQSIFRFRRADVTVWRQVEDDFARRGRGAVVALADNFRSVEPVLGFVDATVGRILDAPIDGKALQGFEVGYGAVAATRGVVGARDISPSDARSRPSHPEPSEGGMTPDGPLRSAQGDSRGGSDSGSDVVPPHPVELLFVTAPDGEKPKAEAIRATEAAAIARRACELHGQGLDWRDMAVLIPAWTDTDLYESALRRAGIPTYALRGEGFYARREVLDLILALETLRDPRDDRALLGFLRSPFVGLRDETLLAIARQADQPYWDYLDLVEVKEQPLLDRARALLEEHVALRDRIPADRLLERLLERSGYLAHLHVLGADGEQALANVRKFVRIARLSSESSVGDFLRALRETRDRGVREGDARLYGEGENVLTITSIHSAKGLEWAVVFWCDLLRKPQGVTGDILIGRDRIVLRDPEGESKDQPLHYLSLKQDEEAEQCAERKRLWYVAATRARDRLILSGLCPGKLAPQCPGAAILEQLGQVAAVDGGMVEYVGQGGKTFHGIVRTCEAVMSADLPREAGGRAAVADPSLAFDPRPLPELLLPLAAPTGRTRHSATELMLYARCPRRHWFRYVAGLREPPVDRSGPEYASAIARGQIVHEVLERLDREDELDPLLDAAIGRWQPEDTAPEAPHRRKLHEELRAEVLSVAGNPEYRALADQPTARRELAFLAILGAGQVAEGKVDLAALEGGALGVLDVKTGGGDAELARARARRYDLQRDTYVTALERIGGMPVGRFGFQFSAAGVQVSEEITDQARRAAASELPRIMEEMAAGQPSLAKDPADCRWCGYRRVGWCAGVPAAPGPGPA